MGSAIDILPQRESQLRSPLWQLFCDLRESHVTHSISEHIKGILIGMSCKCWRLLDVGKFTFSFNGRQNSSHNQSFCPSHMLNEHIFIDNPTWTHTYNSNYVHKTGSLTYHTFQVYQSWTANPPHDCRAIRRIRTSQEPTFPRTHKGLEAIEGHQIIDGRQRPNIRHWLKGVGRPHVAKTSGFHRLDWNMWHAFEHERSGYRLY